jgi:phosphatidylserine/phosphatidylglycerophosphate/cardiolipin synthase-like enzyme
VFFHLKIVVADERRAIVGSANVTDRGFDTNLEVGVLLKSEAANEIDLCPQAPSAATAPWRVALEHDRRRAAEQRGDGLHGGGVREEVDRECRPEAVDVP